MKTKRAKKVSKERVFGANAIHLTEETSSKILGGILEKGFSDDNNNNNNFKTPSSTSSFPLPSSLPFPVARHRSHGPHWTPVSPFVAGGAGVDADVNYDEDAGENDHTNYEPLAEFAKPIKKKNKKGLDLSKWKEALRSDAVSNVLKKDDNKSIREGEEQQMIHEYATRNSDNNTVGSELSIDIDESNRPSFDIRASQLGKSPSNDIDMGFEECSSTDMAPTEGMMPSLTFGPGNLGHEKELMGLEGQIDAENRALLNRMSPEEIAEAQADIRNRINPELLDLLKKRGINKLKKTANSGLSTNGLDVLVDKQDDRIEGEEKSSAQESNLLSETQTKPKPKPEEDIDENLLSKGSSVWSTWSKRVEAVRNLRFSLDGNVIEGNSHDSTYTTDNVAERDFLRTEGDPGAAGYTIKEALALARSVIPGQRAFALHLLAAVLNNALHNINRSELNYKTKINNEMSFVDWEAIWAYALGPEPELALSLRLVIDDNHNSVILASARVIQCILACDLNENIFNTAMKLARMDIYTAPVFRIRPDAKQGFFGGGFWKYSSKPSNILLPAEEVINDKNEGERTIKDDNVVAGQDVAAGLVRMEILPRLLFLLETGPAAALEQCMLSILIAIARHSPTCADAIWNCERLVQTIVERFNMKETLEPQGAEVKSVILLRVLAQSSKTICVDIISKGFFKIMTRQLYPGTPSVKEWVRFGSEKSRPTSELLVEQLRFWKVCVAYGYCISSFTGFFPTLCLFLNPPSTDMLTDKNAFNDFATIATEIYLVSETLANSLPDPYSPNFHNQQFFDGFGENVETWCWNDVSPMVDSVLQWLTFLDQIIGDHNDGASSSLWILSSVMHFLQTVLIKATPIDMLDLKGSTYEKSIPEFVDKIALQIRKRGIFNISDRNEDGSFADQTKISSLIDKLCSFRHKSDPEASLASVWCLDALLRVVASTDRFIHHIQDKFGCKVFEGCESGILKSSLPRWRKLLGDFMNIVTSEWDRMTKIEMFGRGGPAPGVGVGWGVLGGGFWSLNVVAFKADARLLTELLETWLSFCPMNLPDEDEKFMVQIVNSALASSLMMGPGDILTQQKIFGILLKVPVLKYFDQRVSLFLGKEPMKWENKEDVLMQFSKILTSHFTNRWLEVKKKKKPEIKDDDHVRSRKVNKGGSSLTTISEDVETSDDVSREEITSFTVEWARQRMPLPSYWILSPITTISNISSSDPMEFLEVASAGLFFLLGIEAISSSSSDEDNSPVQSIPLVWKLHSLSVPLLFGMSVLEEEKSKDMYKALQSLYGQYLDDLSVINCLRFQTEIHENYSTFIETLVEQFAAVSYGDVIYGRQIAIYLHRQVESSVRLATWNALSNASVLELLPPLDICISRAEGYLEPVEDDEGILEAYAKSWVSGSLDRSAMRGSVSSMIALHHLSSFIFNSSDGERSSLRNKLAKSLLRDYSRKRQHEAMMLDLIQYNYSVMILKLKQTVDGSIQTDFIGPRLAMLREACHGNSQLLTEVHKLECSIMNKQ